MRNSLLPKITVVTPSYNQAQYLETTILSVLMQNYSNIEYIVIDGGSSDQSVDIIKESENKIAYWTSKRDGGRSIALNKGFAKATGDYFIWINSDDVLLPGTLNHYGEIIKRNKSTQWITGNLIWIDANDYIIRCPRFTKYSKFLTTVGLAPIGGPSTLFSRKYFEGVGSLFDEKLHYTMDTDLWWRFLKKGYKFTYTDRYLMAFRFHQASKCSQDSFQKQDIHKNMDKKSIERKRIINLYGNKFTKTWLYLYRLRQVVNGNYFIQYVNMKKMKNKTWKHYFGVDIDGKNPE